MDTQDIKPGETEAELLTAELERLEKYAKASNQKVFTTQSDLDPKVHAAPAMLSWCKQYGDIVVMSDGNILSSDPSSRNVQNCKIVMMNQGLRPAKVIPARSSLIKILLENISETGEKVEVEAISAQQQRLRNLVSEALRAHVSDIHIEVRPNVSRIRFRKHGEMYLHAEWLPKLGREIASVAFNKETDHAVIHFNPIIPQSASMPLVVEGKEVRLRLASLPAHGGFDVVMRILDTMYDDKILTLDELGYTNTQKQIIIKATNMPHGAIIISGPTGSGKTTTLASCISMIDESCKIYTIEDPVEKVVSNATQVPVSSEHADRSFASMGIAALRMDPDVIVLGEMRDLATATVMVRAALTGHLVFSTLHTNTSIGIITRLVDMGISQTLLADPDMMRCLMSQRLMPVLCKKCALPIAESKMPEANLKRWKEAMGKDFDNMKVRGGRDCDVCKGLGIGGRTVVSEVIWIDDESRKFIKNLDMLGWDQYLRTQGWTSYGDHTLELVRQGLCDPIDAEKMIGTINPAFAKRNFDYRDKTLE